MRLRELLESSDSVIGTWSQSSSAEMLEIVGYAGFDFTIIDTEHGAYGLETAENLVRAAEAAKVSPLIRVAVNEPHLIMKALDIGAEGVVVPQIQIKDEAELAVSSAKYHPEGTRGACPCIRSGQHLVTDWEGFASQANRDIVVVALIEGKAGMRNVEKIISTDGLDAVMFGPFDMSVALGVGGQVNHPKVLDFLKKVINACQEQNVHVFLPNFDLNPEDAREFVERWREYGCRTFTAGTDKMIFAHAMKQLRNQIKGD